MQGTRGHCSGGLRWRGGPERFAFGSECATLTFRVVALERANDVVQEKLSATAPAGNSG